MSQWGPFLLKLPQAYLTISFLVPRVIKLFWFPGIFLGLPPKILYPISPSPTKGIWKDYSVSKQENGMSQESLKRYSYSFYIVATGMEKNCASQSFYPMMRSSMSHFSLWLMQAMWLPLKSKLGGKCNQPFVCRDIHKY